LKIKIYILIFKANAKEEAWLNPGSARSAGAQIKIARSGLSDVGCVVSYPLHRKWSLKS